MRAEISKALALLARVKNPVPAVLDRMGIQREPYVLRLRDGTKVELRPRVGDFFGMYEILLRNDYLAGGQRIDKGATVIDVGANIGCFTLLAAKIVGPSGRVIALEPEPSTFAQLLRNIKLNGVTNVVPMQLAVGARRGCVTLHAAPNALFTSLFTSVNGRDIAGVDHAVEMTTIEAIMDANGISRCDYLKLDCEGAEHEIIASMPEATARRIAQITLEVHKIAGHSGATLQTNLETLGYHRIGTSILPYYSRG